jgi:hypothetical protein
MCIYEENTIRTELLMPDVIRSLRSVGYCFLHEHSNCVDIASER